MRPSSTTSPAPSRTQIRLYLSPKSMPIVETSARALFFFTVILLLGLHFECANAVTLRPRPQEGGPLIPSRPTRTTNPAAPVSGAAVHLRVGLQLLLLQLVQPIERRNLVRLRERRIVEHAVAEVLHRPAQRHHRLPDVHDLRRALADHVDAEDLQRLRMEDQLEHPG